MANKRSRDLRLSKLQAQKINDTSKKCCEGVREGPRHPHREKTKQFRIVLINDNLSIALAASEPNFDQIRRKLLVPSSWRLF